MKPDDTVSPAPHVSPTFHVPAVPQVEDILGGKSWAAATEQDLAGSQQPAPASKKSTFGSQQPAPAAGAFGSQQPPFLTLEQQLELASKLPIFGVQPKGAEQSASGSQQPAASTQPTSSGSQQPGASATKGTVNQHASGNGESSVLDDVEAFQARQARQARPAQAHRSHSREHSLTRSDVQGPSRPSRYSPYKGATQRGGKQSYQRTGRSRSVQRQRSHNAPSSRRFDKFVRVAVPLTEEDWLRQIEQEEAHDDAHGARLTKCLLCREGAHRTYNCQRYRTIRERTVRYVELEMCTQCGRPFTPVEGLTDKCCDRFNPATDPNKRFCPKICKETACAQTPNHTAALCPYTTLPKSAA